MQRRHYALSGLEERGRVYIFAQLGFANMAGVPAV
jgi:hypothetical protein